MRKDFSLKSWGNIFLENEKLYCAYVVIGRLALIGIRIYTGLLLHLALYWQQYSSPKYYIIYNGSNLTIFDELSNDNEIA
jgi:hypothetical protein